MTDIKLLPLPEPAFRLKRRDGSYYYVSEPDIGSTDCYTAEQVRACVSSATEALRAEVDFRDSVIATHAADTREYQKRISQAEARAERLAEALLEARQMIRDLLPDATFTKWDALLREQE